MSVPWASGFCQPTTKQTSDALGAFPCPSCRWRPEALDRFSCHGARFEAQLDEARLFEDPGLSEALPRPFDLQDWLAQVPEQGQTFEEYRQYCTLRSGQWQTQTGVSRPGGILLVPILLKSQSTTWPSNAPSLTELQAFLSAFLGACTPVIVSEPGYLVDTAVTTQRVEWVPPAAATKAPLRWVTVRKSPELGGRMAVNVESILACLTDLTCGFGITKAGPPHSIVAVLLEDLYQQPSDLFIAGLAAGGSHVAAFSLLRYHPYLRMAPARWWEYGYATRTDIYPYVEQDKVEFVGSLSASKKRKRSRTVQLTTEPPTSLSVKARSEYLRRSAKLLCHEILHLFLVDHCIYHACLMNGTGHLVEDYRAPSHLCGIDLRKLQFRLGFDVPGRYRALAEVWSSWGFSKQAKWCVRQAGRCDKDEQH